MGDADRVNSCDSKQPELRFLPSGTPEGFSSKAVSSDNDANSSVIVRELIQNCLDAGTPPGSGVKIDFSFEDICVSAVPGIEAYRRAFDSALETHRNMADTTEAQLERIKKSLSKQQIAVLHVKDNGTGLDTQRTNALLSDGLTNKFGILARSAGSYGLGHYTTFPASDLQYVIYGGVTENRVRTMSGHAILASHFEGDNLLGKDGYYILGEPQSDIQNRYRFPSNGQIPTLVDEVLDELEEMDGRGSVVTLLAFNNFRDESDPVEAILRVAARHFYPVIKSGNLIVRTLQHGEVQVLDSEKAEFILHSGRSEKRAVGDVINGSKAYAIMRTLQSGTIKDVDTGFGQVSAYIRLADSDEPTRISLFRSGMFITDKVPLCEVNRFNEYKRFNAVVLVNTPHDGDDTTAFDLIRQSEGEKHSSIDKKRLPSEKQTQFDQLLKNIRTELMSLATKDDSETHVPDGFMELEMFDELENSKPNRFTNQPGSRTSKPQSFTPIPEPPSVLPVGPRKPPGPKPPPKPKKKRVGKLVRAAATARRNGRIVQLVVRSSEDIARAAIRLVTDNGSDASCTSPLVDHPVRIRPQGSDSAFVQVLDIGQLINGDRNRLDVELEHSISIEKVLKLDVFSRRTEPTETDET